MVKRDLGGNTETYLKKKKIKKENIEKIDTAICLKKKKYSKKINKIIARQKRSQYNDE